MGVVIAALIAVIVLAGRAGGGPPLTAAEQAQLGSPAPADIVGAITSIPPATFATVGDGGIGQPFDAIGAAGQTVRGSDGRPEVVYVGGEFCPYCAAERWSLVAALSRFGQFQGLRLGASSADDSFSNTRTLSFHGSSYSSTLIDLLATEILDGSHQPLDTPAADAQAAFSSNDPSGGIPFLDLGGRYRAHDSGYSPSILRGLTWQGIAGALHDPASPVTRAIVGNANWITAGICAATHGNPGDVCGSAAVRALISQLPT